MSQADAKPPAPLQVLIVGILSLLWNSYGGYDYVMVNTRNAEYLKQFPAEMIPWMNTFPAWAIGLWAIGVWGSILGSVLLLLRSRHAVTGFAVSLVGAVLGLGFQYMHDMPTSLNTTEEHDMTAVIITAIVLFWWYARRARAQGLLN